MPNYITRTDIDNWPADFTDAEKDARIDWCESRVEEATGDVFYSQEFDVRVSSRGNGQRLLRMPFQKDTINVSSVSIYDSSGNLLEEVPSTDYEFSSRYLYGRRWPQGIRNIRVQGTRGWSTCPEAVKRAVIILVRHENDPSLYNEALRGSLKEGMVDEERKAIPLTGIREADEILLQNHLVRFRKGQVGFV